MRFSLEIAGARRKCAVLLTIFLAGCGVGISQNTDLDTPVRYTLGGKKYQVPLGYHYVDSVKRNGRWPNPKDEFTEAGAISITGLLPGVRPYEESTRAEFEQLGHGNRISILITPEVTLYPMHEWLARMNSGDRLRVLPSELEGLTHYRDNEMSKDESKGTDIYIKESGYFKLRCPRIKAPSPGCDVTKVSNEGLQIHYSFGKSHLMSWQEIDKDVDKRIEEFRVK